MHTKPLTTHQPITALDPSADLSALRRFLTAAAINRPYCEKLLADPARAVRDGFGGEQFFLSESTINLLTSIRAASLPEFIHKLNGSLSWRLIPEEYGEVGR
jgi:hypothetical protein